MQRFTKNQKDKFEKIEADLLRQGLGEDLVYCQCGNGMFLEESAPDFN